MGSKKGEAKGVRSPRKTSRVQKPVVPSKVHPDRIAARGRNKRKRVLATTLLLFTIFFIAFFAYTFWPRTDPLASFAACLTESGAVMYGTDDSPACQAQKRLFGEAFREVAFTNCEYSNACTVVGVEHFPSWQLPNQEALVVGLQSLQELSAATGCTLPKSFNTIP